MAPKNEAALDLTFAKFWAAVSPLLDDTFVAPLLGCCVVEVAAIDCVVSGGCGLAALVRFDDVLIVACWG